MNDNTASSRHTRFLRNLPSLGMFGLGLILTICGVLVGETFHRKTIIGHANQDAIEYQRMLENGFDAYVHLNRDMAGFFAAAGDVTSREFDTYINSANAFETHPGLGYVGYIPRVPHRAAAKFEVKARHTSPSFKIYGTHEDADAAYPLLYAFPNDTRARQLTGFDFSGVPDRWEAMQLARDLGISIATARQEYLVNPHDKIIIFVFTPIYEPGRPTDTIAQRRAALTGFVYSAFRLGEAIEDVMGSRFKSLFDLEIYEGSPGYQSILYDGDNTSHALETGGPPVSHQENFKFAGRTWSLYFHPKPAYFEKYADLREGLILLSGTLLSAALASLAGRWQRRWHARRLQLEHGQRFQAVFENHPSAVYSLDLQRRFMNANAKALEKFAISKDELIGLSIDQFIVPENVARAKELFHEVLKGNAVTYDNAILTNAGKRLEVSVVLIPVTIEGEISSVLGIAQNITERKLAEWKLQESRQMLQLVIDNIPQRVFWKNTELYFLGCNKAFCEDAGVTHPDEVIGKSDYDFHWEEEADSYRRADRETMQSGIAKINYEEAQPRKDGSEYWLRTSKIPLTNGEGKTIGILGLYENITERKRLEQKLEQMAHYDSLTGLPNRAFLYEQLQQAISRSKRHGSLLGLMYFDIDKFKHINDTYGHDIGDAVITQFARRVKSTVREIDIVGRLGGDEFCMIVEDLSSREAAAAVATKLVEAMQSPFQIRDMALHISTSIGIAFHQTGMATDELIRKADHAMYQAKQSGRNRFEMERA